MKASTFTWVPRRIDLPLLLIPGSLALFPVVQSLRVLLLMPLSLVLVFIGNIVLRRRVRHAFGFCARHRRHRRIALASACLLPMAAMASPWTPCWPVLGPGWFPVLAGFAFWIAYGTSGRPPVVIAVDERHRRFSGCGALFLSSLPAFGDRPPRGDTPR